MTNVNVNPIPFITNTSASTTGSFHVNLGPFTDTKEAGMFDPKEVYLVYESLFEYGLAHNLKPSQYLITHSLHGDLDIYDALIYIFNLNEIDDIKTMVKASVQQRYQEDIVYNRHLYTNYITSSTEQAATFRVAAICNFVYIALGRLGEGIMMANFDRISHWLTTNKRFFEAGGVRFLEQRQNDTSIYIAGEHFHYTLTELVLCHDPTFDEVNVDITGHETLFLQTLEKNLLLFLNLYDDNPSLASNEILQRRLNTLTKQFLLDHNENYQDLRL
jgi:hypothetical protein